MRERGTLPPEIFGDAIAIAKPGVRRLHYLRKCPLLPWLDYHDAEIWYDVKPPCDMCHDFCHRCWREEDPAQEDFAETSESSDDEPEPDGIAEWVNVDEI